MNNDIITYEPENYNSVLMEEYLFESAIKDTYFGKDSSNLYFDYELKHIKRIPNYDNLPTGN